jgi:hypothetical protein
MSSTSNPFSGCLSDATWYGKYAFVSTARFLAIDSGGSINVNLRWLPESDMMKKSVVWVASTSDGTREKTRDRSGNWGEIASANLSSLKIAIVDGYDQVNSKLN